VRFIGWLLTKGFYEHTMPIYITCGVAVFRNALTIDVEDWYHICGAGPEQIIPRANWRVSAATERILILLDEFGVKATFFVLGSVAAAQPELVRLIASAGHEVASHGWSHSLLHQLTPGQFRDELAKTEDVLLAQAGCLPVGFRAPQWSVSARTPWVHDILVERGYSYDSSLSPLPFIGERTGSRIPYRISTPCGELYEFPPLVTPTWFGNLPTGGGWGFRFFPTALVERSVARLNSSGSPAVLYLHPRDADPGGPRLPLSPLKRFASYGPGNDALPRVRRLLERFRFTPLKELVADGILHSDPVL
jgi:polysaccharide deacetylase family protein (PEP-CTERM system associated)